jgi:Rrf2 family transcriptional regulator, iron-sulfur cluster assembly transcription factor
MMELTRKGDYAIRGIIYLASQPPNKISLLSEIAAAVDVPQTFLAKIFQQFSKTGIVKSFRGTGGGFLLAGPPEEHHSACRL